jgi:ABC-type phosphate transport system substrate-binding protein
MFNKLLPLLFLVISLLLPTVAFAEVAVIVNNANNNPIDEQLAIKLFIGSVSRWPSRGLVTVIYQPDDSPATSKMYTKLLHKQAAEVNDCWSKNFFTGKSGLPKQVATDAEVKRLVASNKNSIGYVDAAAVDGSVKVVLTIR